MSVNRPPTRFDLLLGAGVAVAGVVESLGRAGSDTGEISRPWPLAAGAIAAGAIVALRRRYPAPMVLALVAVSVPLRSVMDADYGYAAWQFYSLLILVHTVGAATPLRGRPGAIGLASVLVSYAWLQTYSFHDLVESVVSAVFIGAAYASGILLRRQIERTLMLGQRNARLELEREERARQAVAQERARIARELHDVISHNVGLMTLQAGGARMLLDRESGRDRERDLLRSVERTGRQTVEELRLLLGVLRDDTRGEPAPAGLDRLDELIAQVAETGLRVELRILGEARSLPPSIAISAYRVVQEALTNVLRHAHADRAEVVVDYGPDRLRLTITDDGVGEGTTSSAGHGLIGMRERTAMHGGQLAAGPRPEGGYQVVASFPVDADSV